MTWHIFGAARSLLAGWVSAWRECFFFLSLSPFPGECMSSLPNKRRVSWQGRGRRGTWGWFGGKGKGATAEGCAHTNTLRQSQISSKGLSIDWLDSRAAITYESNSREIRTVGCLMANLPPALSWWQCQPMSRRRLVPPFKFNTVKISRFSLFLCSLLSLSFVFFVFYMSPAPNTATRLFHWSC